MYVGCTKNTAKIRFKQHYEASLRGSNCSLHKAMRVYGIDNFTYKNLIINIPNNKADYYEQLWIFKLNTYNSNTGYNDTIGGKGVIGYKHTINDKQRISNSARQWFLNNDVTSDKYIQRSQKISECNKGKSKSYMHRKHISESRLRNNYKMCGENNSFYGKHHTAKARQMISNANSKSVKMIDVETLKVIKEFDSGAQASKWLVVNGYCNTLQINSSISQSIKSPFKRTTCGFYWSR